MLETSIAKWVGNPLCPGFLHVQQQAQSNLSLSLYICICICICICQELDHFNHRCHDHLYCPSCRASSYAQIFQLQWLLDTCTFHSTNFVALRTTLELDISPSYNFIAGNKQCWILTLSLVNVMNLSKLLLCSIFHSMMYLVEFFFLYWTVCKVCSPEKFMPSHVIFWICLTWFCRWLVEEIEPNLYHSN